MASNEYYNDALAKASVRDLSGAIESLKTSLKFNKLNIDARNLLGLIYFEMGEVVEVEKKQGPPWNQEFEVWRYCNRYCF